MCATIPSVFRTACPPCSGLTTMFGHLSLIIERIILNVLGMIFGSPLVVPEEWKRAAMSSGATAATLESSSASFEPS